MSARFRPAWDDGKARLRPAFDHSAPSGYALDWDFDSANINPDVFTVADPESSTPTIYLQVRSTAAASGTGWIHWNFRLSGMAGKRPIFEIDTTGRRNNVAYMSTWAPVCSEDDGDTWVRGSGHTPLTDPHRVRFQFADAFVADVVWIGDHQPYQVSQFDAFAASLAADTSGLVSPSSSADAGGVLGTSPAETDDLGRAVGGHSIYGFVLGDSGSTTDGQPKRYAIIDCGIHAGEVLDGWALEGFVDYYLHASGAAANRLRANWRVGIYFPLTPNGRYGGNWRSNFRNTRKDPNRDWDVAVLAEIAMVRAAMLADASRDPWQVSLSLHTAAGGNKAERVWHELKGEPEAQDAFMVYLDAIYGQTFDKISTDITNSFSGYSALRGVPVCLLSEFGTRQSYPISTYRTIGAAYAEAISLADADGWFTAGASGVAQSHHAGIEHLRSIRSQGHAGIEAAGIYSFRAVAAPLEAVAARRADRGAAPEALSGASRATTAPLEAVAECQADQVAVSEALSSASRTAAAALEAGGVPGVAREDIAQIEALRSAAPAAAAAVEQLGAVARDSAAALEAPVSVAGAAAAALEILDACIRTAAAVYESAGSAADLAAIGPVCVEALQALDAVVQASAEAGVSCSAADLAAAEALGAIRHALAVAIESRGAPSLAVHAIELLLDAEHALELLLDNPRP